MPRIARPVFAGIPHHITQRGNRRENVFFDDEDRAVYLEWLREYSAKHDLQILAYCLMTNHIHVVAVPESDASLQNVFRPLHTRYAQRINRARGWKGHLWQGRFFSSALDEAYLWAALRYVELNPVRAKMARRAENYTWSSAAAHCGIRRDPLLTSKQHWAKQIASRPDWSTWLAEGECADERDILRRHVERGLPCGKESFIDSLEHKAGQALRWRARGRPMRESVDGH